jgi:hypothetical protein
LKVSIDEQPHILVPLVVNHALLMSLSYRNH